MSRLKTMAKRAEKWSQVAKGTTKSNQIKAEDKAMFGDFAYLLLKSYNASATHS